MRATPVPCARLRRIGALVACAAATLVAVVVPPPSRTAEAQSLRPGSRKPASTRPAPRSRRPFDRLRRTPPPPALPPAPAVDLAALAALADPGAGAAAGSAGADPSGTPVAATLPASAPLAAPLAAPLTESPKPFAALSRSAGSMLEALAERARSQLGTRYVLGGENPGGALDCSAFTRFAMEALGITLPRTAAQQAKVGVAVPRDRSRLRPGDLLTFGTRRNVSHVGIYLGEGRFIHASVTSGRVIETTIAKNARLFRQWLGARRLLADADTSAARAGS